MKKFLIRVTLFLVISLGITIFLIQLVPKDYLVVADDYRSIELKKKMVGLINQGEYGKINIVVGDSKLNHGIDAFDLNAINFSLQGGSPVGSYILLSQLDFDKVDTIFLGYSIHHFHNNDIGYIFTRCEDGNIKEQTKELYTKNGNDEHLMKEFSEFSLPIMFGNIKALAYATDISQNIFSPVKYLNNIKEMEQLNKEILANRGTKLNNESCVGVDKDYEYGLEEFKVSIVYDYYLNKVLELIKEKNKPMVYIIPPTRMGNKRPGQGYYDTFNKYISTTLKGHGFNMLIPSKEYGCKYFKDNVHLNGEGAKIYTAYIRDYLK